MAIKKTELYSSLWKSCDELRGGMDASQYKDYILVILFVKYVSDKFDTDADSLIEIPKGGGFKDMVAAKNQDDIGDRLNKIIEKLAEVNDLKGVITITDFNSEEKLGKGKAMVDRLTKLIAIFEDKFDFGRNRAEGDDILGDAYEYLMKNFATQSGKSKGQFYTPSEVSRIMAKVIGIDNSKSQIETVYDPTCGSGSLLLKAADEAPSGISIFGQEKDNSTVALAKMNMILHGYPTAELWLDDTLSNPHWKDKYGNLQTYDFAVANPPFSTKSWSNGFNPDEDIYRRFEFGIPPAKNGDYAFLLHLTKSLKSTGKGAIILPHGVLFRGNKESDIREKLICRGFIKGVIAVPPNLFYGTGIPACIIVIDKENSVNRKGIFMIDAGKGFIKDGNKNRLRHQDIHKIVDVFNKQIELPKYSRMVSHSEIEKNEYNLNIPRYIDSQEPEDIQDIEAHLKGGIPNSDIDALENYWQVFPSLKADLFATSDRERYSDLNIGQTGIKDSIFNNSEFIDYSDRIQSIFKHWRERWTPKLKGISGETKPKNLIHHISEDLLESFAGDSLIDKYDVYQQLMSYWTLAMQDDIYMLVFDGWKANVDLISPLLIIKRYFAEEQREIDRLQAIVENLGRDKEELEEEHTGEEGLFEDAKNEKNKLTKASVKQRIKEIKDERTSHQSNADAESDVEFEMLNKFLDILEAETKAKRDVKNAQSVLKKKVFDKYDELDEDEVKTLVVDDKWMTTLEISINAEIERITQNLTQRIKTLAERYETPLPKLDKKVEDLESKVDAHLLKMGFHH